MAWMLDDAGKTKIERALILFDVLVGLMMLPNDLKSMMSATLADPSAAPALADLLEESGRPDLAVKVRAIEQEDPDGQEGQPSTPAGWTHH